MYELLTSANDMYYFNLKSSNSQVIGTSEMYESESSRSEGIESVKNNAPEAGIDDQSYAEVSADEGETEMESVSEEESSESEN